MPIGHSGYFIPTVWLVWLMFLAVILLAALYMQVLSWESQFKANRERWLQEVQAIARQIRCLRRSVNRLQEIDPLSWIGPFLGKLGRLAFWLLRLILATRLARP
jgi:hypothetical protein